MEFSLTIPNATIHIAVADLHVHNHGVAASELHALFKQYQRLEKLIMTTSAEFTAGFARVDAATTAIAALIRDLIAKQQAGGMTADEEAAAQTKLLAVADALEAMAATPTDPVPVPVPDA